MRAAKARYQSILANVNEFDRDDRFLVNILSGAMLAKEPHAHAQSVFLGI